MKSFEIFSLNDENMAKLSFLIGSLNQAYFRETIFTLATGAAQPNISNDQINSIPLLFPTIELINEFNAKLSTTYLRILLNQTQNQELAKLRDWLLPMLMNGQVTVGDAYGLVEEKLGMVAEDEVEYKRTT